MKIHTRIVIDMATYQVLEDEWYEYDGEVAQCKGGGGGGTTSKPLNLDDWMKTGPYSWLKDYFGDINEQYPAMESLQDYLGSQGALESTIQNELTGAGGALASQRGILDNMSTPEMMRTSMAPYLSSAYSNIGQAGIPSSSYADKLISSAVTQGWLQNTNNLLGGYKGLTDQSTALADSLSNLQTNAYNMKAQPMNFIQDIQKARYGQSWSKTSGGGKSGGLLF